MENSNRMLECLQDEKTEPDIRGEIFLQTLGNIRKMESRKSYSSMISGLLPLAKRNMETFASQGSFQPEELKEYITGYEEFQRECEKYQIWLVGTEGDCQVLSGLFDMRLVHILGVVDRVHSLLSECDYIFVCSSYDKFCGKYMDTRTLGRAKIVRFDFIWKAVVASLESARVDFQKVSMLEEAEGIITGMSYCQRGICFDKLEKKMLCLARPSQDYYLDYQEVLWAYDEIGKRRGHSLKYCVIEMNFYRLWYDSSLSSTNATTLNAFLHTDVLHHMSLPEEWLLGYWEDRKVCIELMGDDFINAFYGALQTDLEESMRQRAAQVYFPDEEQCNTDIPLVRELFDKNYPETLEENIGILRRMIKFLKLHGVCVLLYLPPFPKIYLDNASAEMREITYQVLEGLQEEFGLECLDLTQCEGFTGEHFADYHHLNDRGAEMATEHLNQYMRENW